MIITIVQVVLKLMGFVFGFLGNKKKAKVWLAKTSEVLRQKGWVRSKFVLELEADRDAYLDKKLKEKEGETPKN